MTHLHIFALNTDPDLRHTNLTRALGEKPVLPPLADWLGLDDLNAREIELFPIEDLGEMSLSDYVTAAFTPDPAIDSETRQRLDALGGSVLLVPDTAFDGDPAPGAEANAIARIPLARPDHGGELPRAQIAPIRPEAPEPEEDAPTQPTRRRAVLWFTTAVILLILLNWVFR